MYNQLLKLLRDNQIEEFAKKLEDEDFDPKETDKNGNTLFDWTIIENRPAIADILITKCPDLLNLLQPSGSSKQNVATVTQQIRKIDLAPPPDEITGPYLYLTAESKTTTLISMAPQNSTGDVYHVLAYIILSLHYKKEIPSIYLTYDGDENYQENESNRNTFTCASISYNFARHLNYHRFFLEPLKITSGTRQNARQSALELTLKQMSSKTEENIQYIDQKGLTTLIAHHFKRLGSEKTTKILKEGFNQHALDEKTIDTINKVVATNLEKIKTYKGEAPLIILHVRYSSKANKEQSIDGLFLDNLKKFLINKGYKVWFIFADGRKTNSYKNIETQRTDPFPYVISGIDYGKMLHIRLLIALTKLQPEVRIIGNTTGTIDAAAFVGHHVLNLHDFQNKLNYQGYRILIQSAFFSIEQFNAEVATFLTQKGLTDDNINQVIPKLVAWLDNRPQTLFPIEEFTEKRQLSVNPSAANFSELFYAQLFKADQTLSTKPLLNATKNVEKLVIENYFQQHLRQLFSYIKQGNVKNFRRLLMQIIDEGFDINELGRYSQRNVLQETLRKIGKNIADPEAIAKLKKIVILILEQGADLTVLSGSKKNAFHYLLAISSSSDSHFAQANSLRLELLTLFINHYKDKPNSTFPLPQTLPLHPETAKALQPN